MKFALSSGTSGQWWRSSGRWRGALCALLVLVAVRPAVAVEDVYAEVVRRARAAAAAPFQPNESTVPEALRQLNYDSYRKITFRRERALWHNRGEPFEVQFFHPGYLFDHPVQVHEVVEGKTRPVPFSTKYFRYPDFDSSQLRDQSALGFAGFRLLYPLNRPGRLDEVISFVGTNYFRALGARQVYGLSARGVAINAGENLTEEFPVFREFWLGRPSSGDQEMQFCGLLDGPSVAGAYRFVVKPGADTTVEIEARLFFRKSVMALGIAPLTSMFWRGEKDPLPPDDHRPEVHDSDALVIDGQKKHALGPVSKVTERRFAEARVSSFALVQSDRDRAHYRDGEAHYERRPSARVELLGDWVAGAVHLLQLPAGDEYSDNVVAFWQPEKLPQGGEELQFKYRLHWFTRESNKP